MNGLTNSSTPDLSVILATVNDSIACNLTCAHIISQLEEDGISYEILLIDNGSLPEEKELIKQFLQYHRNFPIRYFDFNIPGTIPIHSFGVEQARGTFITMPEPHIILSPHYYLQMLDALRLFERNDNTAMVFSPFVTGTLSKKGEDYICESPLLRPNPFSIRGSMGISCRIGDSSRAIMSNSFCGMVCRRSWMMEIGNLFPDAFKYAGGYVAESVMMGLLTWMFGRKCVLYPGVSLSHPVYRIHKGPGRNENVHYSMAVAAYILGGQKYLDMMEEAFGKYPEGLLDGIPQEAEKAREFVQKHARHTLDDILERWEALHA